MKIRHLILMLFLAGICTVNAQSSLFTHLTPAVLTTNQAVTLAIKLANEKYKDYFIEKGGYLTNSQSVYGTNIIYTADGMNNGTEIHTLESLQKS